MTSSSDHNEKQSVLDIWENHYTTQVENSHDAYVRRWMETSPADLRRGIVLVSRMLGFQETLQIESHKRQYHEYVPLPSKEWASIVSLLAIATEESEKEWYWVAKALREHGRVLDSISAENQERMIQNLKEDTIHAPLEFQEAYISCEGHDILRSKGTTPFATAFHGYVCQLELILVAWLWAHIELDKLPKKIAEHASLQSLPEFMREHPTPRMPNDDPRAYPDELDAAFERWKVRFPSFDYSTTVEEIVDIENEVAIDMSEEKAPSALRVVA